MAKLYDTTCLPEYYSILYDTKRRFEMKMPIVTMKLPYHLSLFCHILFAQSLDLYPHTRSHPNHLVLLKLKPILQFNYPRIL